MKLVEKGDVCSFTSNKKICYLEILGKDDLYKSFLVRPASGGNVSYLDFKESKKLSKLSKEGRKSDPRRSCVLYILQLGNQTYKVGCTSDLQSRIKAAKTWCMDVQLILEKRIPPEKTVSWRKYEMRLLSRMHRLGKKNKNELSKLTSKQLSQLCFFLKTFDFQ